MVAWVRAAATNPGPRYGAESNVEEVAKGQAKINL